MRGSYLHYRPKMTLVEHPETASVFKNSRIIWLVHLEALTEALCQTTTLVEIFIPPLFLWHVCIFGFTGLNAHRAACLLSASPGSNRHPRGARHVNWPRRLKIRPSHYPPLWEGGSCATCTQAPDCTTPIPGCPLSPIFRFPHTGFNHSPLTAHTLGIRWPHCKPSHFRRHICHRLVPRQRLMKQ